MRPGVSCPASPSAACPEPLGGVEAGVVKYGSWVGFGEAGTLSLRRTDGGLWHVACSGQQPCSFDEYPLGGAFLMLVCHASVQAQGLFDHRIDATLETTRGLGPASDQIGEKMLATLQLGKQVVSLPETVVRVPPLLPGRRLP